MFGYEYWELGAAYGRVLRCGSYTVVDVRGVLTPQGYEALHRYLALEPAAVTVVLGPAVLLALTNISAVEAALRGRTRANRSKPFRLLVTEQRSSWAAEHAALMASSKMICVVALLPSRPLELAHRSPEPEQIPS